jgi:hypothetical protein
MQSGGDLLSCCSYFQDARLCFLVTCSYGLVSPEEDVSNFFRNVVVPITPAMFYLTLIVL